MRKPCNIEVADLRWRLKVKQIRQESRLFRAGVKSSYLSPRVRILPGSLLKARKGTVDTTLAGELARAIGCYHSRRRRPETTVDPLLYPTRPGLRLYRHRRHFLCGQTCGQYPGWDTPQARPRWTPFASSIERNCWQLNQKRWEPLQPKQQRWRPRARNYRLL